MLKARLTNGIFVLGIDANNIKRLMEKKPILVSLAELGGTDDVLIMAGESIEEMVRDLEEATGSRCPKPMDIHKTRQ